jgi:bla regulator protein blaR1
MMPQSLSATFVPEMCNHLWQSTVVVLIAWLLALALHNNHARTRYWIWMIASLKFLIPFSLFIAAGELLRARMAAPLQHPALADAMQQLTLPFAWTVPHATAAYAGAAPVVATGHTKVWLFLLLAIWLCGASVIALSWMRSWWKIRIIVRASSRLPLLTEVPVLSSPDLLEPGIFGIVRPVLLLPEGIESRLTSPQLDTIIAHEMCHVRRRDNLTAAIHMMVAALFWFHPAVWWIKARLLEERERACDEAVLLSGNEAPLYAESILNVCKFYVESPLTCVSGITGADLKRRIARIMAEQSARRLDLGRKLLLGLAGSVVVAMPVVFGLVHIRYVHAQTLVAVVTKKEGVSPTFVAETDAKPSFEVATIKPNKSGTFFMNINVSHDTFSATNVGLQELLQQAYGINSELISGLSGWANSTRFDINAKSLDIGAGRDLHEEQLSPMLQELLVNRFHLKVHRETKILPVYDMVIAKGGIKFKQSAAEGSPEDRSPDNVDRGGMNFMDGQLIGHAVTLAPLVDMLTHQLHRTIIDRTGLTGKYNFTLTPPSGDSSDRSLEPSATYLFTSLPEQLGLKLQPSKGPVETLVVDHVEMPSEN